jgi:hypothetical protein
MIGGMVAGIVAYVTGVVGIAKEPVVACGGMSSIDVQYRSTPIAGGGLLIVRYENALSRNHEMRW